MAYGIVGEIVALLSPWSALGRDTSTVLLLEVILECLSHYFDVLWPFLEKIEEGDVSEQCSEVQMKSYYPIKFMKSHNVTIQGFMPMKI